MERTQEEKDRQIAGLLAEKAILPEYSMFGDPNWKIAGVQIAIIKGEQTLSDYNIVSIEDDGGEDDMPMDEDYESEMYDAAERATNWLNGADNEDLFSE